MSALAELETYLNMHSHTDIEVKLTNSILISFFRVFFKFPV
jgi:hypothetical protein